MQTHKDQPVSPVPVDDADTATVLADLIIRGVISQHWCEDRNQTVFRLTDEGRDMAKALIEDLTLEWNRHDGRNDTTIDQTGTHGGTEETGTPRRHQKGTG